ncbi:MAG: ATP-binding protein [Saprospiraceae bacterium]|nr:ATP-binding protein [Saprospiraceae bacterium]
MLTGKNGSGKTSVLERINNFLKFVQKYNQRFSSASNNTNFSNFKYGSLESLKSSIIQLQTFGLPTELICSFYENKEMLESINSLTFFNFNCSRKLNVEKSSGVKDKVANEAKDFEKYLAKKRTEQAFLSFEKGNEKEVKNITDWFEKLEAELSFLFEDATLKLQSRRNEDKLSFYFTSDYREEFDLNTLSSGYSSILFILFEMMQQMHSKSDKFEYTLPGIAIIDEVEAHLHISLQKKILPFLTRFFPNVQFIVSTHSPFILQSLQNAVIFDLETKKRFEDFSGYSSESILETYYQLDKFSEPLKAEMNEYENMLKSSNGQFKDKIKTMRKKFLEIADIEVSYWIKDMDIRYKDKIKELIK